MLNRLIIGKIPNEYWLFTKNRFILVTYLGFVNNEFHLSKFEDFIRGELVM